MIRTLLHLFKQHLRIGYVSGLLLVDCAAVVLIAIDVYRFLAMGLPLGAALGNTTSVISNQTSLDVMLTVLSFVVVMPLLIAVTRISVGTGTRWSGIIGVRKKSISYIHIALSALIACSLILIRSMQSVSGYTWSVDGLDYEFIPRLQPAVPFFAINIVTVLLFSVTFGLGILGNIIAALVMEGPRRFYLIKEYIARCLLADLGGDLYPVNGRHKLNFNCAAIAPEIRSIKEHTNRLVRDYQDHIPGSNASTDYLLEISKECKRLLKHLLFSSEQTEKYEIEFFPGTSRALEVALSRIGEQDQVILSPFEHPVETNVVKWFNFVSRSELREIRFEATDYSSHWQDQRQRFITQLLEALRGSRGATSSTLLLSQVCYATGMVIPVWDTIAEIRRQLNGIPLRLIVDGAHYVGNNNKLDTLGDCESYVFSAHKWLLAPEPIGILIGRHTSGPRPYDSWHDLVPSSTSSTRAITGLLASLEMLTRVGFEHLWSRSRELREKFLERTKERFEIVGENTGLSATFMITIRPKQPFRWGSYETLAYYLHQHSVSLHLLSIDPHSPWLRVALPYFLEFRQLKNLCDLLEGALIH